MEMRKSTILVVASFVGTWLTTAAAIADPYFDHGADLYKKRDFKNASLYFEQSIKANPADSNTYYYSALSFHQLGDRVHAIIRYKQLVQTFPGTPAAQNAMAALMQLDPAFVKTYRRGAATSGRTALPESQGETVTTTTMYRDPNDLDLSHVPERTKIYYKQRSDTSGIHFIVPTEVNNRPIEMLFDTGASNIVMGKNHLRQLGIAPPPAGTQPTGMSHGVGTSEGIPYWTMLATLKVGDIIVPNCPIDVQDNLPTDPLLGETLFKHFAYTIDYGAHSIVMTKKGSATAAAMASAAASAYSVPFIREGNEMVVVAEINGRPYKMYFDTGAMGIAFSKDDCTRLNIPIPEDAVDIRSTGVGGTTTGKRFAVSRMKLGPVDRRDVEIAVLDSSAMGRPLLGQDFYAGWQYTIDNANMRINFVRR
jgi:clan AA aspartic protease (TIGR02281 family)